MLWTFSFPINFFPSKAAWKSKDVGCTKHGVNRLIAILLSVFFFCLASCIFGLVKWRSLMQALRSSLPSRRSKNKEKATGDKTLWSVHFGVVVVELINCKCGGIVRNDIWWEQGVNLWNYEICQDNLKRATSKRPTCQTLAFRGKLSLRH